MKLSTKIIAGFVTVAVVPLALVAVLLYLFVNTATEDLFLSRSQLAITAFRFYYEERLSRLQQTTAALSTEKQFLINILELPRSEARITRQLEDAIATGEFQFVLVRLYQPPTLIKTYEQGLSVSFEKVIGTSVPRLDSGSHGGIIRLVENQTASLAVVSQVPIFHRGQIVGEVIAGVMFRDLLTSFPLQLGDISALLVAERHQALFASSDDTLLVNSSAQLAQIESVRELWQVEIARRSYFVRANPIIGIDGNSKGRLMYIFDQQQYHITRVRMLRVFALIAGTAILIAVTVGLIYQQSISRPVKETAEAARQIAAGKRPGRIIYLAEDEIGDLVSGINRLTEDLAATTTQLRRSEQVAAWQMFARQLAHEIRNFLMPLSTTLGYLERQVSTDKIDAARLQEGVQAVKAELMRMRNLLGSFSDFARLPAPTFARVDVTQLAGALKQAFPQKMQSGELTFSVDDSLYSLRCDAEQIRQVLLNLVINAFEARASAVTVNVRQGDGKVVFEVIDDGCGIDLKEGVDPFTPLFTTKKDGSGLGLAICRRIVVDHGGDISYTRNPTGGTTFTFYLPQESV